MLETIKDFPINPHHYLLKISLERKNKIVKPKKAVN